MFTEVLSQTGLTDLPAVGLVLFFVTFVLLVVRLYWRGGAQTAHAEMAQLPLCDDDAQPTHPDGGPSHG